MHLMLNRHESYLNMFISLILFCFYSARAWGPWGSSFQSLCLCIFTTFFANVPAFKDSKFMTPYQNTIPNNICKANDYDKYQYCLCQSGQRISVFKSHHDNRREDRIWQLKCAPIQAKLYIPSKDSKILVWSDLKRKTGMLV